ncbi:MAG: hypothetical protein SV760_08660 [Halobacteria archaeon]|nr:hypothetical protein [Halobacteria archaeon]
MTRTATSNGNSLSKIRLYRRVMFGSLLVGVLGFMIAENLGYPVVGVGVYWAGIAGYLGIWLGTSVTLFDERDCALERRASAVTLTVSALALITIGPAEIVLSEMGVYSAPPAFEGAVLAVSAQGLLFGVVYLWLRYGP